ncbi:hypothetical protein, partial [Burkholderia pseudomallei]|uniref:hypothetical protein n=1 Tax=Burkholderia pseudomallei TaxID=28450 RepID=UPI0027427C19
SVVLKPVDSELMPVEVDVDNEATVLLVVDSPVDSELTPLCAVLMPEEADVESEVSELFVLLRPVTARRRCCWSCSVRSKGR